MTGRSGRGRWERVLQARRQARTALGRDPVAGDLYEVPPRARTTPKPPELKPIAYGPGIGVVSLGEAAARLGVSRRQLDAMIDQRKIEALPTGYTKMIATREVERFAPKA